MWPLAALTVVITALGAAGALPVWPGLPHLVALPPLDLYTDLRVLLTRATSVPGFVAVLALVFAVRVAVLAAMLGGITTRRLRFAALCYAVAFLPLLLAAQVNHMAYALLYSRAFWPTVAVVAAVVVLGAAVPWQGTTRLRSALRATWRGGLRIGVVLAYAAAVIAVGVAAHTWSGLAVPLVPVSALLTGVTVRLLARPPRPGAYVRLAVAVAAFVVAASVFVVTRPVTPAPVPAPREGSLLIMSGISSSSGYGAVFHMPPERFGLTCDQIYYYSYAGKGDGQPRGDARCPIRTGAPYSWQHTGRPMAEQVAAFADQVRDLPRPLTVAGHSHAAWVAWQAVSRGLAPEVDALILIGPFSESTHGYLDAGERGQGRVASLLLRELLPLTDLVDFRFDPDAPAVRETLADAVAIERIFATPLPPNVRAISVTSATDLPLMPHGWRLPVERNACPVREAHPYLPTSDALYREVNRFLDRRPPPPCPAWRTWGAAMSWPFGVPPADA
ncbi:MAG: hypothetical protein GEU97_04725 [Actinophytocola sp.]|nr:hypothetical protein [Actinophytocola sp.]